MISASHFISPNYYSNITNNQLTIQKTLLGQDLTSIAMNANYLAMNGTQQIPTSLFTLTPIIDAGTVCSARSITFVNANNNERIWSMQMYSDGVALSASLQISGTIGISSSSIGSIQNPAGKYNIITLSQSLNYTGSSLIKEDTTMYLYYKSSATAVVIPRIISMFTAPQRYVNPTIFSNQQAIDIQSVKENQPIYSSLSNQNSSIAGIANTIQFVKSSVIPTKGIFSMFSMYELGSGTYNWSSPIAVSIDTSYISYNANVYGTSLNSTSSIKTVDWYAYVGVEDAAQPGRLELTSSVGTAGKTFNNTVPVWISGSILVEAEDFSFQNTINPSKFDDVTGNFVYNIRKTVSTNSSAVAAWTLQIFEGNN